MTVKRQSPVWHDPVTGVDFQVVDVSPAMAEDWLKLNVRNRGVNQSRVIMFGGDMAAGAWVFLGDPVRFDSDGDLIDGQHRLLAIVRSGTTQRILVITNLPPEAQELCDHGAKRTTGQVLAMRGEANANVQAALTKRVAAFDRGVMDAKSTTVSQPQVLELWEANQRLVQRSAEVGLRVNHETRTPPSTAGQAFYLCTRDGDAVKAAEFFARLAEGIAYDEEDPVRATTRALRRIPKTSKGADEVAFLSCLIAGYNAYARGARVYTLTFDKRKPPKVYQEVMAS